MMHLTSLQKQVSRLSDGIKILTLNDSSLFVHLLICNFSSRNFFFYIPLHTEFL